MKILRPICFGTLVLFMLCLEVWCDGDLESGVSPMEKSEQEALYSAIQGFVGKWWNGSDLYPDPCGWTPIQGVACDIFDGFWYVTTLNIGPVHDNSLGCVQNVEFPPHLFELKHLKSMSIFNCFMSPHQNHVTIPTRNWEKLADRLESLEFRSNPGLIGQIPTTFGHLTKLQILVLIENGLTGEIPVSIGNLGSLKCLVLAENRLMGRIPDSLGGLNQLLIFDLSRNYLSGSLPNTIGGLISLLKLDLSNNFLEGKIPMEIGNMKNLTLLDLGNNRFSGGLTPTIQEMCSLEEMVLSNNKIGGDIMSIGWKNLKKMVILDLSKMGLTGEVPESIAELKNLRFLGLNDNNFTGNLSRKLEFMSNVSAIYVNGNNLTGELKFSDGFYRKMGRLFRAWNNPNLCYSLELISSTSSKALFGVNPCQNEGLGIERLDQSSEFMASLGVLSYDVDGFWWGFMAEVVVVVVFDLFI